MNQELQEFRSYRMDLPIRLVDGAVSSSCNSRLPSPELENDLGMLET
jgi:hypothetical protein